MTMLLTDSGGTIDHIYGASALVRSLLPFCSFLVAFLALSFAFHSASASFRMRDTSSGTASTETLSRSALADRMNHHFGRIDRYYVDREILSVSSSPAEGRIYVQDTLSEKGIRANRVYASESRNKYVLVLAGHTYTILYQEAEFTDVHTRRRKKAE